MDTDQVLGIIKQVSADIVEPRFRALHEDEIDSKAPGDYVTVADREAERALSQQLRAGARDAVVVGEEGSFVDPGQLDAIGVAPHCFVVDPLDGTNNFVRGSEDFAVMVAELRGVETVGAWIYQPRAGKAYVATRGGGVYCNGERISAAPIHVPPQGASTFRAWRGFDEEGRIAPVIPASGSAGIDYPHVVTAAIDFVVYRFPSRGITCPASSCCRSSAATSCTWTDASTDRAAAGWRSCHVVTWRRAVASPAAGRAASEPRVTASGLLPGAYSSGPTASGPPRADGPARVRGRHWRPRSKMAL
ncbi:hypothetical protein FAM14222_000707 [Propionibacterium freudenreichii]|uniref:inositol monophosphatase family protein n=2 Tax=Propionibacterium freudenreichii TaxID=1744 RepID=UPI00254C6FAB|nr:inositol monophosphatase family protein [Propionibacterium freudenreichii]MDK9592441.1 hypothetical protein [Propionibacterium freudenreichii]